MSKELTPLEAWEEVKDEMLEWTEGYEENFNIIETALKEKEIQDNVIKTLKEIIEFSQMLPHIESNKDNDFDIISAVSINIQRDIENKEREILRKWVLKTCFPKELKALEIIKEKEVNVEWLLETESVEEYNESLYIDLTQEEYELLKEVLLCGSQK